MRFQKTPIHGFTSRANGLVRELKNEIFISEAYRPEPGVSAPPREKFVCIWDTGATNTVVTRKVVDSLGLQPSGRVIVRTVGEGSNFNEYEVSTYLVNLSLPNNVIVGAVPVSEGGIGGADVLIGMDIITMEILQLQTATGSPVGPFACLGSRKSTL